MFKGNVIYAAGIAALSAGAAQAAPVQWSSLAGGNDHWYEVIFTPNALTWTSASALATSMTNLGQFGHLATVTSAAEQAFLDTLNPNNVRAWLGGTDALAEGVWQWVTGETWSYTNWNLGEPNDQNGEDYLSGWWNGDNTWNDLPDGVFGTYVTAYVVEFPAQVPLPAGLPLLLGGLGALGLARRRKS